MLWWWLSCVLVEIIMLDNIAFTSSCNALNYYFISTNIILFCYLCNTIYVHWKQTFQLLLWASYYCYLEFKIHQFHEYGDNVFDSIEDPMYDKVLFSFAMLGNHEKLDPIHNLNYSCVLYGSTPFYWRRGIFCHVSNTQFKVMLAYFTVFS